MEDLRKTAQAFYGPDGDAEDVERVLARLAWRRRRGGKECSHCGETLPVSAFGPRVDARDGLRSACRACEADGTRARRGVSSDAGPLL